MKDANDVINEWTVRGLITADQASENNAKYKSYIEEARDSIIAYCNLPPAMTGLPEGLFKAWVRIAWDTSNGAVMVQGSGEIKTISEGDTAVTFDVGTKAVKGNTVMVDYSAILNRFRRLF